MSLGQVFIDKFNEASGLPKEPIPCVVLEINHENSALRMCAQVHNYDGTYGFSTKNADSAVFADLVQMVSGFDAGKVIDSTLDAALPDGSQASIEHKTPSGADKSYLEYQMRSSNEHKKPCLPLVALVKSVYDINLLSIKGDDRASTIKYEEYVDCSTVRKLDVRRVISSLRSHLSDEDIEVLRHYDHELIDPVADRWFIRESLLYDTIGIDLLHLAHCVRTSPARHSLAFSYTTEKMAFALCLDKQGTSNTFLVEGSVMETHKPTELFINAVFEAYQRIRPTSLEEALESLRIST